MTTQAHDDADRTRDQAQAHCALLSSEAQHKAEDMVNKAGAWVETMLGEARSTAETLHRQSREQAAEADHVDPPPQSGIGRVLAEPPRGADESVHVVVDVEERQRFRADAPVAESEVFGAFGGVLSDVSGR